MAGEKISVQIFFEEQLKDREFAKSFYHGLDELRIITRNILDRGLTPCRDDGEAVQETTFFIAN